MNNMYDYGYQIKWRDFYVTSRKGYFTSVSDFHKHDFYEINLIISGNIKILLKDKTRHITQNCIVLTRPGTPHYISCEPDTLYNRLYLLFSNEFISDYVPEWKKLISVFGKNGKIITITEEQKDFCEGLITHLKTEQNRFRQRMLILYLLSHISEFADDEPPSSEDIPRFVMDTLSYIEEHYSEKIIASELAKKFYISRTTLMTNFKKYTCTTLNKYLTNCRLKNAIRLLNQGKTENEVSEICGFSNSSGLIRSFKGNFGMTPRQYLLQEKATKKPPAQII